MEDQIKGSTSYPQMRGRWRVVPDEVAKRGSMKLTFLGRDMVSEILEPTN